MFMYFNILMGNPCNVVCYNREYNRRQKDGDNKTIPKLH